MTSSQLHTLAARLAAQDRITHSQACAKLARRRRCKSKTTITTHKPSDFAAVERPAIKYWWQE